MLLPLAETPLVRVWAFSHHGRVAGDPGEEVFLRPTMVFTSAGRWQVTSAAGRGVASPAAVVLGNPGQAYRCRHDHGFTDRPGPGVPPGRAVVSGRAGAGGRHHAPAAAPAAPGTRLGGRRPAGRRQRRRPAPGPRGRAGPGPEAVAGPDAAGRVAAVREHIERHFADPGLSLAALARVAGWSPSHLIRAFRAATGQCPHRWLPQRRLDEACRLLDLGQHSVTDICWLAGFGSLSHFVTTFRRETGVSPGAYRRRAGSDLPQARGEPPG